MGSWDDMVHHNFYLSERYEENFRAIFRDYQLPDDPSFYAVVPTKTEPRMAPDGMESLFVLVPVPHSGRLNRDRDGDVFGRRSTGTGAPVRARPWARGLREVRTPETGGTSTTWRRGPRSASGTASSRSGYFRPPMVSKAVEGMYFVGASTRPGTGVPLVTIGARLVADRIGREVGAREARPRGRKEAGRWALARRGIRACRKVQKAQSRTYYLDPAIPAEVRPHVQALYAFMRYADEIVDTPHDLPLDAQLAVLEEFEAETLAAARGRGPQPHTARLRRHGAPVRHRPRDHNSLHEEHEDGHQRVPLPDVFRPGGTLTERSRGRPHDVQGGRGG